MLPGATIISRADLVREAASHGIGSVAHTALEDVLKREKHNQRITILKIRDGGISVCGDLPVDGDWFETATTHVFVDATTGQVRQAQAGRVGMTSLK